MTDPVQISVVIPTYNRALLIARAIESVLKQTRKPDEIIVIDDGSTDDTKKHIEPYLSSIRYIYQKNAGASASRNHGVEAASFPWVAFLDSDDLWTDTHLERMAYAIEQTHGQAQFYFTDMALAPEDGGGTLWESIRFSFDGPYLLTEDASDWVIMLRQPTMLQSAIFKRTSYLDCGGLWLPLRLTHDTHIFMKLGFGGSACAVAGCGTIQTSDDSAGTRLTTVHSGETRSHWEEAIVLWRDALKNMPGVSRRHRKILQSYLCHSLWRLSRLEWSAGKISSSLSEGARALVASPTSLIQILSGALARKEP
jgi:glycosyltransferase involved in cell wall biosynthesis